MLLNGAHGVPFASLIKAKPKFYVCLCCATCYTLHWTPIYHCNDVIMSAMASQITGVSIVCSTICSSADQRNHQSSASLAFVRGMHRSPVDPPSQMAINAEIIFSWWRHHYWESMATYQHITHRLPIMATTQQRPCVLILVVIKTV